MAPGRASRAEPLRLLCLRAAAPAAAPWPGLGDECLAGGRWAAGEREAGLRAPNALGVGWRLPHPAVSMDPGAGSDSSLTVNEQVIVMSGHETIRVLEVGVDAQLPAEEESKGLESVAAGGSQSGGPVEASGPAEAGSCDPDHSAEATVKSLPGVPPSPAPAIATFNQAPSQPQASQTLTPLAVQAAPQVKWLGSRGWPCGQSLQQLWLPSQD